MIGVYLHFALQQTAITKVQISSMFVKYIFTQFASLKCYAVSFHWSNMNFNLSKMITDNSLKWVHLFFIIRYLSRSYSTVRSKLEW